MTSCTQPQSAAGGEVQLQVKFLLLLLEWHVHCYLNYLPLEYAACETFDLTSAQLSLSPSPSTSLSQ